MSGNYLLRGLAVFLLCGCSPWVIGLSPKNPPIQVNADSPIFPKVASLQPTLQWESFSEHKQRAPNEKIDKNKVGAVTYELKIWKLKQGYPIRWSAAQRNVEPGALIYSRKALPQPRHIVEEPLEPSTKYIWTSRARYQYNGTERLTEWGQQFVRPLVWVSYFGFRTPSQ